MKTVINSVFIRVECSVAGRGGSRTALTGVVVFNKAPPCAAGSILPSASADGYKRQEAKPLPLWA